MVEITVSLQEQIQVVAKARLAAQQAAEDKKASRLQWEAEHKDLIVKAEVTDMAREAEETKLRELTLAIFRTTGDKHPDPNVGIREVD